MWNSRCRVLVGTRTHFVTIPHPAWHASSHPQGCTSQQILLTPSWRDCLTPLTALRGEANSMQATSTPSAGATCFIMMLSVAMVVLCCAAVIPGRVLLPVVPVLHTRQEFVEGYRILSAHR